MLFIIALMFSVNVHAASMDLSATGDSSFSQTQSVTIGTGNALLGSSGAFKSGEPIKDVWNLSNISESSVWKFKITATAIGDNPTPFSAVLNGITYVAVGADIVFTALLSDMYTVVTGYNLKVLGTAQSTFTGYDVNISEVPVPAALFLFAPALLGFLGLRRKSALAVAA